MPTTCRAYASTAPRAPLAPTTLELEELGPHDVEIEVACCGLCHSDVHLLDDAWGTTRFPLVPGHEIVGRVVARGGAASLPVGARVGVGWQAGACLACRLCLSGQENLCPGQRATCSGHAGGLAERVRVDGRFAFPVPDAIASAAAAPLLCGGVTVWAPLRRFGAGATTRVGVVGIGGLGHLAIRFARALGCEVTALSSSPGKRDDALAMGATDFVASTDARALRSRFGSLDLVLSTAPAKLDWALLLGTLRENGTLCFVGLPPGLVAFPASALVTKQRALTASDVGGRAEIAEMLAFAAERGVVPEVERMPMEDVARAVDRLRANEVRYRVVLER